MNDLRASGTLLLTVAGHFFTVAPVARHLVRPRRAPLSVPFHLTTEDRALGPIALTGRLHHAPADDVLVVVHGLGGDIGSHYVLEAVRAADAAGIACLRVNIRGSDRTGEDIYHAALTEDLHAVLASPELARYRRVHLLGYSLGGHIVLRAATEEIDPRVRSVAAVCPPLDLHRGSRAIDEPSRLPYRRHVLNAIKDVYAAVTRRREAQALPLPLAEALRIRTLREWDERIVVPRFGYEGVEHYYNEASVAPRLGRLEIPSLVVAARHDPMVPAHTLAPILEGAKPPLEVRWIERGGHVGFPAVVDLGMPGAQSLEDQLVAWHLRNVG
ncbi:alpha/beta fold hydrolase [Polyangium aurulentum]|uniref:alpha/beta fold hydrolase n=1 Tax=Polyangium aurulentum TaxID=2567896 RepID=UPI001F2DF592|nr:alpha/beta fold hydrolase [Polyangium aurulentum]